MEVLFIIIVVNNVESLMLFKIACAVDGNSSIRAVIGKICFKWNACFVVHFLL